MSIARFTHVSQAQYAEAMAGREGFLPIAEIPMPKRATTGSAGYDFVSPLEVTIPAGETALIPTGIRAEMEQGWFAKNEGHIMVKLRNPLSEPVTIGKGERFCQGVFLPYGTAEEDEVTAGRVGGFGSTDR